MNGLLYERMPFCLGQGSCVSNFYSCPTLEEGCRTAFRFLNMPSSTKMEYRLMKQYLRLLREKKPSTVFGHSSGAVTAVTLARFLPSVKKLVLLAPAPMPGMPIPWYLQKRMLQSPLVYLLPTLLGKSFLLSKQDINGLMINTMDPMNASLTLPYCNKEWLGSVVREMAISPIRYFDWRGLENVEIHVICGSEDRMIMPSFARKVGNLITEKVGHQVLIEEIPGADHMLMCGDKAKGYFKRIFEKVNLSLPTARQIAHEHEYRW